MTRLGARRVRGDEGALDELVRIALHQVAVLEDARLPLLAIGHDVLGLADRGPGRLPLAGGGEERAAAPEEAGGLDGLDDLERRPIERARQAAVGAVQQRIVEALGVDGARAGEERALLARPEGMARGGDEPAPGGLAPRDARGAEGAVAGQGVEERGQLGDRDALEDGAGPAGVTDLDRRGRVAHAIARACDDLRVDTRRREGSMQRGLEIPGVHGSAARARLYAEPQRGSGCAAALPPPRRGGPARARPIHWRPRAPSRAPPAA